jgi:GNAT superfamily N-acetyltransferase
MALEIYQLPAACAGDAALVAEICVVVNRAFEEAERRLWRGPYPRTNVAETAAKIAREHLVVARVDGAIAGAVWTRLVDATTGWFGALGVDPARGGAGIARALIAFVERGAAAAGASTMRLEVLAPRPPDPHTDFLAAWYARLGYREVGRIDLAVFDPASRRALAVAGCDVATLERPLA